MKVKVKPGQIRRLPMATTNLGNHGFCYYVIIAVDKNMVMVHDFEYKKETVWLLEQVEEDELI